MKLEELRTLVAELRDEAVKLSELEDITPEQDARLDEIVVDIEAREAEIVKLEARQAVIERAAVAPKQPETRADFQAPTVIRKTTVEDVLEDRSASSGQIRDALLRSVADRDVDDTALRAHLKRHGNDTRWARNLLARSTDVYEAAFQQYLLGRSMFLTDEQRAAVVSGTDANGGLLLPTHLDPSVILTNNGSANIVRQIARVVSLTQGDTWNGITSGGVTASFDAELTEVSDDSPTFVGPAIPVHRGQAFVQASVEAVQDISGLASEVLMMFADAKDRLEGAAHCTGSGSNAPTGIFTALDANTNVEVTSTTAATIGLVDLQGLKRAVPQRFRGRSSWLMAPVYADAIKALGTALSASYSTDLTEMNATRLLGAPLYESDDAPTTQTTTVRDNEIVVGDFSNYVIVDKPGSGAVKYIDSMFATANNLPNGTVGWHYIWRSGADSVNDLAFRLLQDKTTA